jgi:oligopeptide transport system substrate-binding protein
VGLFVSCSKRETDVSRGDRAQILYRSAGGDVADLDPHIVPGIAEGKIIAPLFEPLVGSDEAARPEPALAESWDLSPDGLTYTFHLRAGLKWSNGEPLTAQDCVDSWRRILTPSLAADYAYLFYVIKGAENFHQGRQADFAQVGLAAPDPQTLRVTLEHPVPYFLQLLPNTPWRPVNVRSIAAVGDAYRRGTPWTRPGRIVTSGPFMLKAWTTNDRVVVVKSPTYWDQARVRLTEIDFALADNEDTEVLAFRSGQRHVTEALPPSKIAAYRQQSPALLRTDPYFNTFFFRFNTRRAPFTDQRVRAALSLAIDRTLLAEKILQGGQRPAPTFVHPLTPGYTPPEAPLIDLAAARQLLTAAGFPAGRGLPTLTITFANSTRFRLVAEAVQEMWRRELGLDVRLVNREFKTLLDERRRGDFDILLSNWLGDYPDATTFLDILRSGGGNNHTGWSDPAYDALLDEAARTLDPTARTALLRRAEALMLAAVPIAPLYFNTHVYLLQTSVRGWHPTVLDQLNYKNVWLEETK